MPQLVNLLLVNMNITTVTLTT